LTRLSLALWLGPMEVHFKPDVEAKIKALASDTGRDPDELVQEVMAAHLDVLAEVRATLDSRYDDLESGRVKPISGKAFFESLRQREEELLKKSS